MLKALRTAGLFLAAALLVPTCTSDAAVMAGFAIAIPWEQTFVSKIQIKQLVAVALIALQLRTRFYPSKEFMVDGKTQF